MLAVDISRAPYAHLKKPDEHKIDTLPLALYKVTGGKIDDDFFANTENQLVLQPFF